MPETLSENPENEVEEVELVDIPDPPEIDPILGHIWRQEGPYLVCKSCELSHALYIGINKELTGFTEEGKPILKKR